LTRASDAHGDNDSLHVALFSRRPDRELVGRVLGDSDRFSDD
jgi:hypothetical protein